MNTSVNRLSAAQFLQVMRKANRQEAIEAIIAYTGSYNPAENFGSQEYQARMQANREVSTRPLLGETPQDRHRAYRSVQGYLAGIPNPTHKRLQHLKAQEKQAVEDYCSHLKQAQATHSPREAQLQCGLAHVEQQRLDNIRKEINRLR